MDKKYTFYLVVNKTGHVTLRKNKPIPAKNRASVKVTLLVPTSAFSGKDPVLEVVFKETKIDKITNMVESVD